MPIIDINKIEQNVKNKYAISDNTFINVAKDYAPDKIEVEVGDIKTPGEFLPQAKMKRWDNEVNLSVRLVHDEQAPTVVSSDEKIVWQGEKVDAVFYDKPEISEDGAYEFEVWLKEKPKSNIVKFTIETKDLNFYYQPALTEQEIADGLNRPDDVIGSYAVYHASKRDNIVGGKEYKTGKAYHIYRPEIIDANGDKVWGELNVDTVNKELSITIPQDFLDKAVYPVIVDPTFGYTSVGATGVNICTYSYPNTYFQVLLSKIPSGASGDVTGLSAVIGCSGTYTVNFEMGLFSHDSTNDVPENKLAVKAYSTATSETYGFKNFTLDSSYSITNTTYWVGLRKPVLTNEGTSWYSRYDTASGYKYARDNSTNSAIDFQNPYSDATTTEANKRLSIYATYTESGGSSASSSPSASPSSSPSNSPSSSPSNSPSSSPSASPSSSPSSSASGSAGINLKTDYWHITFGDVSSPSNSPSSSPSNSPSSSPSSSPSHSPSASPSNSPSSSPSHSPSNSPSTSPSSSPSNSPSTSPSNSPSSSPSSSPSNSPSTSPSGSPSNSPSSSPSNSPSTSPSSSPSNSPSTSPSNSPSNSPSSSPSDSPSASPSSSASASPSGSASPSSSPSPICWLYQAKSSTSWTFSNKSNSTPCSSSPSPQEE